MKRSGAPFVLTMLLSMSLLVATSAEWGSLSFEQGTDVVVATDANDRSIDGMTPENGEALLEEIRRLEYHISPGADGLLSATNLANSLRISFQETGVELTPRTQGADGWKFGLSLATVGREGAMTTVEPTVPEAEENRVDFHRGALTEWYVNDERGLEQGFTLLAPIDERDSDNPLRFGMTLTGDLKGLMAGDGQSITFSTGAGVPVLRYAELGVWDALDLGLPAHIVLDEGGLAIIVDIIEAVYPITIDPLFTVLEAKLTPTDAGRGDYFGRSVSIDGDTAVVGAYYDDDGGTDSGSAHVFCWNGITWIHQAKLTASDASAGDWFGQSVSISGNTIVVGAFGDGSGSAYVFEWSGTTWTQKAKLTAYGAWGFNHFGSSVSISGSTVVVGAPDDDHSGKTDAGSAYVFERPGTGWVDMTEDAKLTASDAAVSDTFGSSVSIDGNTVVVGAPNDDHSGKTDAGSTYVFERPGTGWVNATEDAKLTAPSAQAEDRFGTSVSISADTVVIGAPYVEYVGKTDAGSAYVFHRSGTTWTHQGNLIGTGLAGGDLFGWSVSVWGDKAVVGSPWDDYEGIDPYPYDSGSAYVFKRSGTIWSQEAKLTANDAAPFDEFGRSVAVSGNRIVSGSPFDDDGAEGAGSAYVFYRSATAWTQQAKLAATDAAPGDNFGDSVAIDGDTAVVGSPRNNDAGADSGSAYVFQRNGITWILQAKFTASDAAAGDRFGISVSISGDTIAVGAIRDDDRGTDSGSVYVFQRSGTTWTEQVKLYPNYTSDYDWFGYSVSIDGDTIVVGVPYDDDKGNASGSAFVFQWNGMTWSRQAILLPDYPADYDRFGESVSISGNTIAVGAPYDDDAGVDSGSAYVFHRTGTAWSKQAKRTGGLNDWFGSSVSIDADTLVVGAKRDDYPGKNDTGSASVYHRSGATWYFRAKLRAGYPDDYDRFGTSVSVSGDTIVVGVPHGDDGGYDSGLACVFIRSGSYWFRQANITAYDGAINDRFGESISIDGDTIVVGTPFDDDGGADSGSAYVFIRTPDTDEDGIPDRWESYGIDINGDGVIDLDLPSLGADPYHKDLFVEVDAMSGRAPSNLTPAVDAFAAAPNSFVNNPDGKDGITLHLQMDEDNITLQNFPDKFADFDPVKSAHFGTFAERASPNWNQIKTAKSKVFRYALFANTHSRGSSSGSAEPPGNDLMVTLGAWTPAGGTPTQQVNTFMHELGHNLGLRHGGAWSTNYKPNYMSIMNYKYQMSGVNGVLDYSHGLEAPINEDPDNDNDLEEDQNGDGILGEAYYYNETWHDLNPNDDNISDYNDWANLRYELGGHPNFEEGVHVNISIEMTYEEFLRINDSDDDSIVDAYDDCPYESAIVNGIDRDANDNGCPDTPDELLDEINAANIHKGIKQSLDAKLQNANKSYNKGNDIAGNNQLRAFINEVRAQTGKKIPQYLADLLIAMAENIIALH